MASDDAGYNPLAYHDGTVWPHDNSLIAWGLARYGRQEEALRIMWSMFEAASFFDFQLPEVFAGFSRADAPHPIVYPTASKPQAWAAGTIVLLLRLLVGIEPDAANAASSRRHRRSAGLARHPPAREHPGTGDDLDGRGRGRRRAGRGGLSAAGRAVVRRTTRSSGSFSERAASGSPGQRLKQQLGPAAAALEQRLANGREPRVGGGLDVVEADDGELVRDARRPRRCAASSTPSAWVSEAAKIAVGGSGRRSSSSPMLRATWRLCVPSRTYSGRTESRARASSRT